VSLIDGKPAVELTYDRETVLSPNFGPDQSDYYWKITAPCLPWPTCAHDPTPISVDRPSAGEPPYVPPFEGAPHAVPLPGSLPLVLLGAVVLAARARRSDGR